MRRPPSILVFPGWTDNPYLNLMSLAPRAAGWRVVEASHRDELEREARGLGRGDVLHVHWTRPVVQMETTDRAADAALRRFGRMLRRLRRRGVRLVWTVHNRMPHEVRHAAAERRLYRLLARSADRVLVMAPDTQAMLADVCEWPREREVLIPHPGYAGVYGAAPDAGAARRALGVAEEEPTVLFFGQMRPYKGLDQLIAAVELLEREPAGAPTLLLAGRADESAREELGELLAGRHRVVADFDYIDDAEVAGWFAAADVVVLPYRAILNSGSLHLAAAYGVPVLLPGEAHLIEQYGAEPWVRFFDPADAVASIARLLRLGPPPVAPEVYERFNRAHSPWEVSRAYAAALEELVR